MNIYVYILNIHNRKIHRNRNQISGYQELGVGEERYGNYHLTGTGFSFGMVAFFNGIFLI